LPTEHESYGLAFWHILKLSKQPSSIRANKPCKPQKEKLSSFRLVQFRFRLNRQCCGGKKTRLSFWKAGLGSWSQCRLENGCCNLTSLELTTSGWVQGKASSAVLLLTFKLLYQLSPVAAMRYWCIIGGNGCSLPNSYQFIKPLQRWLH